MIKYGEYREVLEEAWGLWGSVGSKFGEVLGRWGERCQVRWVWGKARKGVGKDVRGVGKCERNWGSECVKVWRGVSGECRGEILGECGCVGGGVRWVWRVWGDVEECVSSPHIFPHISATSTLTPCALPHLPYTSLIPDTSPTPQHTFPFLPPLFPLFPYSSHTWPNSLNYQKFPNYPTIHTIPNSLYSSIPSQLFPILPHAFPYPPYSPNPIK